MSKLCQTCNINKALIRRPKDSSFICNECFYIKFQTEIHETIVNNKLFVEGDRIAVGTSGGKDSTVLVHILNKLNKQYKYKIQLFMLAIDEGIKGYRDDSLQAVKRNQCIQQLPLLILSYQELYGWTMDEIVSIIGRKYNCTYCGVFRRQAFQRGAIKLNCNKIVTGHNADDIAETILMNMLRGDLTRLNNCVHAITHDNEDSNNDDDIFSLPRVKPLKYAYQKEIVMYAYHKKLDYFSTQCVYSPFAYRGHVRQLIKQLELQRPQSIIDIIYSTENIKIKQKSSKKLVKQKCQKCGYMTSRNMCKACVLLISLNKNKPKNTIEITQ